VCAATFFDWVQLAAALAAVAAVWFALETVLESRALRREDRIDGLLERIEEYADAGIAYLGIESEEFTRALRLPVAHAHLSAALASSGEELPACRVLLAINWKPNRNAMAASSRRDESPVLLAFQEQVDAALHEVAAVLTRLRDEGSLLGRLTRPDPRGTTS
jgi:hypothetical protein